MSEIKKAVTVRLYVDLKSASSGIIPIPETKRVAMDRYFIKGGPENIVSFSEAVIAASDFCYKALKNGISYIDDANIYSTRYIPAQDIVTAFQLPLREITDEIKMKEQLAKKIRALPYSRGA